MGRRGWRNKGRRERGAVERWGRRRGEKFALLKSHFLFVLLRGTKTKRGTRKLSASNYRGRPARKHGNTLPACRPLCFSDKSASQPAFPDPGNKDPSACRGTGLTETFWNAARDESDTFAPRRFNSLLSTWRFQLFLEIEVPANL